MYPYQSKMFMTNTCKWFWFVILQRERLLITISAVWWCFRAYCTREDVKPLSTADFGKVMKQIFPSIRPRRLGTRGNSRYCYAAMRKTTKLECPQLPHLGNAQNDSNSDNAASNGENQANSLFDSSDSWKVIKMWAENLLNAEFKGPYALAEHISTNYMSGATGAISSSSRALLQKKLLQRKVRGRKKKSMSMCEVRLLPIPLHINVNKIDVRSCYRKLQRHFIYRILQAMGRSGKKRNWKVRWANRIVRQRKMTRHGACRQQTNKTSLMKFCISSKSIPPRKQTIFYRSWDHRPSPWI